MTEIVYTLKLPIAAAFNNSSSPLQVMPPPRERIVNSLNSVRRRGRKVEIAESLYGEKMTVEANDRNRFQLVYLWAPRMSKKVSPGIPKEHPIPPNHAEVYPKVPDGEELVAGNGTKLFIEVGIMIGSDPESFFTAAGESEKHRSVLGQAISPTPTSRHRDALRVFMPVHDSMAKQSSFYAGYGPGNGRLTPHRIRCQGVFFYSELWKGVKRRSNFGQRRRGLLKACRRHATVAVSASEKALSATTTSFDHNALPKDAKVEPSRTLSKVHNPRTKAAEVVDLTTLDEAESVPSTHSNFDSSDVNLSVSTRPRRLVNDSADATHQPDTSGSDGPWIPRKKRRVSTKTSPATKVATRGHALEDSPSRSADPGSSTKKTDSVKRIQDVRVGATNEGIDAFMTFDKELTLELAIRAAEELKVSQHLYNRSDTFITNTHANSICLTAPHTKSSQSQSKSLDSSTRRPPPRRISQSTRHVYPTVFPSKRSWLLSGLMSRSGLGTSPVQCGVAR